MGNFLDTDGVKYLVSQLKNLFASKSVETNGVGKLSTSRKIFGHYFDGTQDVSGGLTLSGNVDLQENDKYILGSSTKQFKWGYFNWVGASEGSPLRLAAADGGDDIHINVEHNVGIGTTTPEEKLHVNGKLKIGSITLEDVNGVLYVNGSPIGTNSGSDTPTESEYGSIDNNNSISVDDSKLSSGSYILKYVDASGNPISEYEDITTFNV